MCLPTWTRGYWLHRCWQPQASKATIARTLRRPRILVKFSRWAILDGNIKKLNCYTGHRKGEILQFLILARKQFFAFISAPVAARIVLRPDLSFWREAESSLWRGVVVSVVTFSFTANGVVAAGDIFYSGNFGISGTGKF